jgi:hypothetical protein
MTNAMQVKADDISTACRPRGLFDKAMVLVVFA